MHTFFFLFFRFKATAQRTENRGQCRVTCVCTCKCYCSWVLRRWVESSQYSFPVHPQWMQRGNRFTKHTEAQTNQTRQCAVCIFRSSKRQQRRSVVRAPRDQTVHDESIQAKLPSYGFIWRWKNKTEDFSRNSTSACHMPTHAFANRIWPLPTY